MKKTYINPTTVVVNIELQQIIAASLNGVGDVGGTATLTDESADSGTDGWARGGGGFWDED